jgi:hypothetical protein
MKRSIAAIALAFIASAAFAAEAAIGSIKEFNGKVEIQRPGAAWTTAKRGDSVFKGSIVSVGFRSSAVIQTADSVITVKALTRLSIEDIVKTSGGTKTELFLSSGSVRTEVTPAAGQKAEFRVKSPTATASVRGTGFEFDGVNLIVFHGAVMLTSNTGRSRIVRRGYASFITSSNDVIMPFRAPPEGIVSIAAMGSRYERDKSGRTTPVMMRPIRPAVNDSGTIVIAAE